MTRNARAVTPGAKVSIAVYSLLLSVVVVLGWHFVLSDYVFDGTVSQCYIAPFRWLDAVVLIVVSVVLWVVLYGLYALMNRYARGVLLKSGRPRHARRRAFIRSYQYRPVSWKWLAGGAAVFFLAWLPYLLTYWPGLIFGDTTSSLSQAQGLQSFSNHHPVFFTLLIKACLWISAKAGFDATAGCALFCVCQMIVLALVFSYQVNWLRARFEVHKAFCIVVVLVLALSPYIATYSIAMWKDPLFSAALVVLTLMLADLIFSSGAVSRRFLVALGLVTLVMCLLRNNGIYIAALLFVVFAIAWVVRRQSWTLRSAGSLLASVLATWVITVPIYTAVGVSPSERMESLGVPLAQMARVVAVDGDMTDSDREYMNSLLPLEEYKTVYHPCLIDSLKWNSDFHAKALKEGFFQHYVSMFVRNPGTYVEAWVLQTFGFWTVNVPEVVWFDRNIPYGDPRYGDQVTEYGIQTGNLLGSDDAKGIFPLTGVFVPIGVIFWALIYLGLCASLLGRKRWLLVLAPSLALVCTLIVASPIWYWPRYAAALQFLLPLWIVLFAALALGCYDGDHSLCDNKSVKERAVVRYR